MHTPSDAPDGRSVERSTGSWPALAGYLVLGAAMLTFAYVTVHGRPTDELLRSSTAQRSHTALTRWIDDGYWHFAGLLVLSPRDRPLEVYRSSTGGYMVSGFVAEKVFA